VDQRVVKTVQNFPFLNSLSALGRWLSTCTQPVHHRENNAVHAVAGVKVTDLSERGGSGGGMMVVGGSWTSVTSHLINWMLTRGATEEH
jgi:hypothetical protein